MPKKLLEAARNLKHGLYSTLRKEKACDTEPYDKIGEESLKPYEGKC